MKFGGTSASRALMASRLVNKAMNCQNFTMSALGTTSASHIESTHFDEMTLTGMTYDPMMEMTVTEVTHDPLTEMTVTVTVTVTG